MAGKRTLTKPKPPLVRHGWSRTAKGSALQTFETRNTSVLRNKNDLDAYFADQRKLLPPACRERAEGGSLLRPPTFVLEHP
jgi:hypothetical protein